MPGQGNRNNRRQNGGEHAHFRLRAEIELPGQKRRVNCAQSTEKYHKRHDPCQWLENRQAIEIRNERSSAAQGQGEQRANSQVAPEHRRFVHMRDLLTLNAVSYTHLRAHETVLDIVCRLLL